MNKVKDFLYDISDLVFSLLIIAVIFFIVSLKLSDTMKDVPWVIGHWAWLMGETGAKNLFALDTGCVWGGTLTAMDIDTHERFACDC